MNLVAYIVAVVMFLLAAFGVTVGSAGEIDLIAVGLAAVVLAHILPPRP